MMMFCIRFFTKVAIGVGLLLSVQGPLNAQSAMSSWESTPYSRARIISGGPVFEGSSAGSGDAKWQIGLQIKLDSGWKTYWRMPGDAGVPPRFDWSRSENVGDVSLEWPAPGRYSDEYATTIGYTDEVVFPIVITRKDQSAPAIVRVDLDYAVCKNICIPAHATLAINLASESTVHVENQMLINAFRQRVPRPASSREAEMASVSLTGEGDGARLVIDLKIRDGAPPATPKIFVEGPEAFFFGNPDPEDADDASTHRMTVPVHGVTAQTPLSGKRITLTVVDGDRLVEHKISIK